MPASFRGVVTRSERPSTALTMTRCPMMPPGASSRTSARHRVDDDSAMPASAMPAPTMITTTSSHHNISRSLQLAHDGDGVGRLHARVEHLHQTGEVAVGGAEVRDQQVLHEGAH